MGVQMLPISSGSQARVRPSKITYRFRVRDDRDGQTYDVTADSPEHAVIVASELAGQPLCSPVAYYISTITRA